MLRRSFVFGPVLAAPFLAISSVSAEQQETAAHFHHVRLNVIDETKTIAFYKTYFGATEVNYRNKSRALFTERSFLLLDVVSNPPPSNGGTSLWHIGWSGVDGASEFEWRAADGIDVQTPVMRPVLPGLDNKAEVMYFWGPDKELVEISTVNRNHRFEHVHLLASEINVATVWFESHLGLKPVHAQAIDFFGVMLNVVRVDNVDIVIFARPTPDRDNQFAAKELWPAAGFRPTDGHVINHLAFSYSNLEPVFGRISKAGVPIVRGLKVDPRHGHKSFFARGPDGLLLEIVQDRPIPEGIWSE